MRWIEHTIGWEQCWRINKLKKFDEMQIWYCRYRMQQEIQWIRSLDDLFIMKLLHGTLNDLIHSIVNWKGENSFHRKNRSRLTLHLILHRARFFLRFLFSYFFNFFFLDFFFVFQINVILLDFMQKNPVRNFLRKTDENQYKFDRTQRNASFDCIIHTHETKMFFYRFFTQNWWKKWKKFCD